MISLLSAYSKDTLVGFSGGHLDYDLRPVERRIGEFKFFVAEAEKCGGPVLELASGAARVLMPLAEAGIEAFGLEASPFMLDLAKKAIAKNLRSDVQKRVHLIRGDMCNFYFRRKFPLIIIPYDSFWWNFYRASRAKTGDSGEYKADRDIAFDLAEKCTTSIMGALEKGGRFIIDNPYYVGDTDIIRWWQYMSVIYRFSYSIECPYKEDGPKVIIGEKI